MIYLHGPPGVCGDLIYDQIDMEKVSHDISTRTRRGDPGNVNPVFDISTNPRQKPLGHFHRFSSGVYIVFFDYFPAIIYQGVFCRSRADINAQIDGNLFIESPFCHPVVFRKVRLLQVQFFCQR